MATNTQVRIGHCSPDAPAVDVIVDGETVASDVSFKNVSDYMELPAGSHDVKICPAGKPDQPVIEKSLELEADHEFTILAIGTLADIDTLVLNDKNEEKANAGRVRFVHAAPDAPSVDVAFDGAKLFTEMPFGKAGAYASVDAGSYELQVMPAGKKKPVLSVPDVTVEAGKTYTAFAVGQLSDDSLDAIITLDHQPMVAP
ncbi:DUF4397 domain-containing protein [Haloarchaeobius amylolyticus]|uniref:DUF4397 domain-containing protein n=1 Tax=Haloarchaeobius amylolyticus TaxID=1198296 RepID=UPI002271E618|nr:DUF4397 domain-containing protein [Haloarchaeobius amylolyticus]